MTEIERAIACHASGEFKIDAIHSLRPQAEQSYIFILEEDGETEGNRTKFKRIPVSTGINDLGFVEINIPTEMAKNIKVVTVGAYTLSSEMVKGELEHGH